MRLLPAVALLAILVSLGLAATGSSAPAAATATPVFAVRGVAFCIVYHRVERLVCTRRGDPSKTLSMRRKGSVRTGDLRLKEGVAPIAPPELEIGQTWSQGRDFRCRHRRSGLTCRNASNHGWWLKRSAYRIF